MDLECVMSNEVTQFQEKKKDKRMFSHMQILACNVWISM